MKLSDLIRQPQFESEAHRALLNVMATSSWITGELAATMAPFEVTPAQYNVLRILRGTHPDRLSCTAIGERLLDRTPDVTRLLNRLQRAGLVHRARAKEDRRMVQVGITEAGLDLLCRMEQPVRAFSERLSEHLTPDEQALLNDLLERLRTDQ
ncbi:MAG: MarR family transcriptional regulator [Bacteroidota bacterium]